LPNLNLIESLGKLVKKKCLYGKYYENFSDFSSAIYECLNDAQLKHKKELDSLLTLGFQKFNKSGSSLLGMGLVRSRSKTIDRNRQIPFYIRVPSLITPVHCIRQTEEP